MTRRVKKDLEKELVEAIVSYPFPGDPFAVEQEGGEANYSEAKLRDALFIMTERIVGYLKQTNDQEVFELIRPKVKAENILEYLNQDNYRELFDAKTFVNVMRDRKASPAIENVLRAFQIAVDEEKKVWSRLSSIEGRYNVYNVHTRKQDEFQISNITIDRKGSHIEYISRRFTNEKHPIQVELVSSNKVWIVHRMEDCILAYYGFIGMTKDVSFFQAPFMYNNHRGETLASLAIFQKVPNGGQLLRPTRHLKELPTAIPKELKIKLERFLRQRPKVLIPLWYDSYHPFDFSVGELERDPGPYGTKALFYDRLRSQLCGQFYVFYTEQFASVEKKSQGDFSSVGRGILRIYPESKEGGVLKCQFHTKKNDLGEFLKYEGYVINQHLNNASFAMISLYLEPYQDRNLSLVLNLVSDNTMIGTHNIMYSPNSRMGAGAVVLIRKEREKEAISLEKEGEVSEIEETPTSYDYITLEEMEKFTPMEQKAVQYLSFVPKALVVPPTFEELKSCRPLEYAGQYRMYSYGERGSIRISYLNLYKNGAVQHLGVSDRQTTAYGHVEVWHGILNILLRNDDNGRTGFMAIKVENVKPQKKVSWYVGTFAGVTRRQEAHPLASIFVLEFLGEEISEEVTPILVSKNKEGEDNREYKYKDIHEEIRTILKAKIDNFRVLPKIYNREQLKGFADSQTDFEELLRHKVIEETRETPSEQQALDLLVKNSEPDYQEKLDIEKQKVANELLERAVFKAYFQDDVNGATQLLIEANNLYPDGNWMAKYNDYISKAKSSPMNS